MTSMRTGAWIGATLVALAGLSTPTQATQVSPGSLAFGGQSMGTTAAAQIVTVTNDTLAPIQVTGVTTTNAQFAPGTGCAVLAPTLSCQIFVSFTPAVAAGALNSTVPVAANLTITTNAAGSPHTVALTGTGEKSLVTHFYRAILRRAPDPSGKAFWEAEAVRMANLGANVNEVWYAQSMFFFNSAEYTAFNRTANEFVGDLYNTYFNRPADAGGLAFWTGQLASGMPREVVLVSFLFSNEFTTFAANIFGNTSARAEVDVVGDFYRGLLARLPDDGGFQTWVAQFRQAQCQGGQAPVNTAVESISSNFAGGAEYVGRNRTNAQYVGDLYNSFLRRGGDLPGVNFWITRLDTAAMTRNQVRQQFLNSAEFQGRVTAIVNQGCLGNQYYLSPSGNNAANGRSPATAWKTFAKAFGAMAPADELVLLDGTYSTAAGTGAIDYQGTNSAQPKSGTSLTSMTVIRAQNPGNVFIDGPLFIGRSTRKDSFIKIQGITFRSNIGSSTLYNADNMYIKDCGFSGGFSIGTNDHNQGSDFNLVEDVWIWATGQRIIAINYRAKNNVWRRVLVRGDGCGTAACTGSGNPNVGMTVYDSQNISFQNVMVIDRILATGDEAYGNFASAQHTADPATYLLNNEWLGTMSIKAPDSGYHFEADFASSPSHTLRNVVAWDAAGEGINIGPASTGIIVENATVNGGTLNPNASVIRIAPGVTGTLRSFNATGAGKWAVNSSVGPTFADAFGTFSTALYNQSSCSGTCLTTNPRSDTPGPSLKHLTRIEAGSKLKAAGFNGGDMGANVLFRYGLSDGLRVGQGGFNVLSAVPLWPWPNEARIKAEMCGSTTRGFCSTGKQLNGVDNVTLTSYIWEYLGNPRPAVLGP